MDGLWLPEGKWGKGEVMAGRGVALSGVSEAETGAKGLDPCGQVGIIVPHCPGSRTVVLVRKRDRRSRAAVAQW